MDGSLKINVTDAAIAAGGVALSGDIPNFDDFKIGYDNNGDDDIDDVGDDLIRNEDFESTTTTTAYDHAGNLVDDGTFRYVYDAWNRLVAVKSSKDAGAVTFQTAEFYADGRRAGKNVTNSGDFDVDIRYYYDGQRICETRVGTETSAHQQFIHGTRYIDELVMVRVAGKGDLYVHQDANWNVIGLSDMGGTLVERNVYKPYGEVTVHTETGYGDYTGDGKVNSTDRAAAEVGGTCRGSGPTGACRILDLDFDGTVDSSDATLFDALPQGNARHPGRIASALDQPFGHQALLFEPEIGSYQNRHRQYDPGQRRFLQRDPLAVRRRPGSGYQDGLSIYAYLSNAPIGKSDPFGAEILVCNRRIGGIIPGNHAYFWDDRDAESCGMSSFSGSGGPGDEECGGVPGCGEDGPWNPVTGEGDCCVSIPNSGGAEDEIMNCCKNNANNGIWFPWINDCHNTIKKCGSTGGGFPPPGPVPDPPGGRLGDPNRCKSTGM